MEKVQIQYRDINNKTRVMFVDNNIVELDLNSLGIVSLESKAFYKLKKLQILWLYNNNLNELQDDTFVGLTNLEKLYLYHNKIQNIPETLFQPLHNLKTLELSQNKISQLHPLTFCKNVKLEKLVLDFNSLYNLPQTLFSGLIRLENLVLSSNTLNTLPDTLFSDLINLQFISLSFNSLGKISKHLFTSCKELREIRLDNNPFKELDLTSIQKLSNLEKIDVLYCTVLEKIILDPVTKEIEKVPNAKIDFSVTSLQEPPPMIVERGFKAVVEHLSPFPNQKTSLSDIRLQFGIPSATVKVDKCLTCKQTINEPDRNICKSCEDYYDDSFLLGA